MVQASNECRHSNIQFEQDEVPSFRFQPCGELRCSLLEQLRIDVERLIPELVRDHHCWPQQQHNHQLAQLTAELHQQSDGQMTNASAAAMTQPIQLQMSPSERFRLAAMTPDTGPPLRGASSSCDSSCKVDSPRSSSQLVAGNSAPVATASTSATAAAKSFNVATSCSPSTLTHAAGSPDDEHDALATVLPSVHVLSTDVTRALGQSGPSAANETWSRGVEWRVLNYAIIPLCLPLFAIWWCLSLIAAAALTCTVLPSVLLARQLYWACPFIPHIWTSERLRVRVGVVGSWLLRFCFEGAHCMSVLSRLLTLPMRPHLPHFYILGFPKCGTTSLASYLRQHPALSGLSGMPGNEAFSKESHFFGGILGRHSTTNTWLYKSFFPTILTRWWCEAVLGVQQWMCFDACPTYVCQPHVAARIKAVTPTAKLVVMVRNPTAGVFSAETMLRNMGVPLPWSLTTPLQPVQGQGMDSRFEFQASDNAFWDDLEQLPAGAPLPASLPERFYFKLHSYLMAGRYADRLQPWIREFGWDNILLVDHQAFKDNPQLEIQRVLDFVGVDIHRFHFKYQQPCMAGDYRGTKVDPQVSAWLSSNWWSERDTTMAELMAAQRKQAQSAVLEV